MSLNSKLKLPFWLPERLSLDSQGYDATIANAYQIFEQDLCLNPIHFKNKPIKLFSTKSYLNYIESFYHVTSKNAEPHSQKIENYNIRIPDFDRVIRIPWIRPLLTYGYQNDELLITETRFFKERYRYTYAWWQGDVAHLIVLEDRNYHWQLISSYHFNPKAKKFKTTLEKQYPQIQSLQNLQSSSSKCIIFLKNQKSVPYYK